ncbi:hypothetical protein RHMOL_Rhmol02G0296300 [Rhododendron molle]|uniref:Uncharacterized protein n=1 Tax=Rhododendron molle TaxID=49168 RepID=A0ACC0PY32_RHOML|nr:hypothetical protein RHMOL_Rhmol02G0296300 [Rhododendron molle]
MMVEYNIDNQAKPLAPATIYGRSDEEFPFAAPKPRREKKSSKCPVYFLLLVTVASILVFIFANIVLRVAAPSVTLNSVTVEALSTLTGLTDSINGTLVAEMDIDNNNFGYFGYYGSSIAFLYQNVTLGVANVTGGRVFARQTDTVNVTVQVRSTYALAQYENFTSDLSKGVLELRSFALLAGKVHIRKLLWRKSYLMNCTMNLCLGNQTVQDLRCL